MEIKEIKVKSCMSKSKITDYVINPYLGCQHGCKYCYAVFMKKYTKIKEEWGDFCYVKINCPELLEKELKENPPGHIWLSSVTDPYLPLEGKYKLTRKILDIIAKSPYKNKFTIEILTKSALVKRDFDLIKQLNAELGCSINTLDSNVARILEPLASPPKLRIEALKEAKKQEIKVYAFISPLIPGITKLDELLKELKFADYINIELLNTKSYIMSRLMPVIEKNFPYAKKEIDFYINNFPSYYEQIKQEVKILEKKHNLKIRNIFVH